MLCVCVCVFEVIFQLRIICVKLGIDVSRTSNPKVDDTLLIRLRVMLSDLQSDIPLDKRISKIANV